MKRIIIGTWLFFSLPALAQTPAPATTPAAPASPPATASAGQKAYISDRLNLGLYLQPDPTATPVKSLPSGMQVQILETRDAFVRIRMIDGNEGWARAEFITAELPAKVLLQQVTRERDQLREQLNSLAGGEQQLSTQLTQARQKIQQLEQQLANPQSSGESTEDLQLRHQQAQRRIEELERQLENNAGARSGGDNIALKILGLLATLLLSIGLGAVLGARWLGTRVRRRFNGLKVW
jgi:SH3 domain protein